MEVSRDGEVVVGLAEEASSPFLAPLILSWRRLGSWGGDLGVFYKFSVVNEFGVGWLTTC